MKTRGWTRVLSILLTVAMIATLLVVPAAAAEVTRTLQVTKDSTLPTGGVFTDHGFTFTVTDGTIAKKDYTFTDDADGAGSAATFNAAISFSGRSEGKAARTIAFTTDGAATVKVWWERTAKSTNVTLKLWNATGKSATQVGTETASGTTLTSQYAKAYDTLSISEAGDYRLGIVSDKGNICKVEVSFEPVVRTVTVASGITGGTVSVSPESGMVAGDTVTVNVNPETGKQIYTLTYTVAGKEPVDIEATEDVYSFTMPNADVTINATFGEACNHEGTTSVINKKEATCVEDGYTGDTVCTNCNAELAKGEVVNKTGKHNYVNAICSVCHGVDSTADGVLIWDVEKTSITESKLQDHKDDTWDFTGMGQNAKTTPEMTYAGVTRKTNIQLNSSAVVKVNFPSKGKFLMVLSQETGKVKVTPPTTANASENTATDNIVLVDISETGWTSLQRVSDSVNLYYMAFIPSGYAINKAAITGGSVTIKDGAGEEANEITRAESGDTVYLTADPDANHTFASWSVTQDDEDKTAVDVTEGGTFTMPASAVTVSATFDEVVLEDSTTPTFADGGDSFQLMTRTAKDVTFTLAEDNQPSGATYKLYDAATDGNEIAQGAAVVASEGKITFTLASAPTADTTYHVSVTEANKAESARAAVSVKAYIPVDNVAFAHAGGHTIWLGGSGVGNASTPATDRPNQWQLVGTATNNDGKTPTNPAVTFAKANSDNDTITITESGLVTANKVGDSAVVILRSVANPDITAQCTIVVRPKIDDITVKNGEATVGNDGVAVKVGDAAVTLSGEAVVNSAVPTDQIVPNHKAVTWSLKSGDAVTVNAAGTITPVKFGTAVVKATSQVDATVVKNVTVTVGKGDIADDALSVGNPEYTPNAAARLKLDLPDGAGAVTWAVAQGETDVTASVPVTPLTGDSAGYNYQFTAPANSTGATVTYTVTATVAESENWNGKTLTATFGVLDESVSNIVITDPAATSEVSAEVGQSDPVSLSVTAVVRKNGAEVAEETGKLTYAWTKNGTAIDGANAASYTVPADDLAAAGELTYVCTVSSPTAGIEAKTATFKVTVSEPKLTAIKVELVPATGLEYDDITGALTITGKVDAVFDVTTEPEGKLADINSQPTNTQTDIVRVTLADGKLTISPIRATETTDADTVVTLMGKTETDVTKVIKVTVKKAAAPDALEASEITVTRPTTAGGKGTIKVTQADAPTGTKYMIKTNAQGAEWAEMTSNPMEVDPGTYLVRVKVDDPKLQEITDGVEVTVPAFENPTVTMGWQITEKAAEAFTFTAETKVDTAVTGAELYLGGVTWKWTKDTTLGNVMQGQTTNPSASSNIPNKGAYLRFKATQAGTLKVKYAVMSDGKQVTISDRASDDATSATAVTGFPKTVDKAVYEQTITAQAGHSYYFWVGGSKIAMVNYTFTTQVETEPDLGLNAVKTALEGATYTTNAAEAPDADAAAKVALAQVLAAVPAASQNVAAVTLTDGALSQDGKSYTFKAKVAPFWDDTQAVTTATLTMSIADAVLVESVTIEGSDSVHMRQSITLTAKVLPEEAAVKDVEWSSSDETKATVSSSGKVTGVAMGEVTITATATDGSGKSGTKTITVLDVDPNVFDPTVLTVSADRDAVTAADVSAPFGATSMIKRADTGATNAYAIETKSKSEGSFTFTVPAGKTGTLTIDVASTGSGNTAKFQMTDADGKAIENKEGLTSVTGGGSDRKTLTYENLSAGTYTLAPNASEKALRIYYATAAFEDVGGETTKYAVTVIDGKTNKAEAAEGEEVTVSATRPAGKAFDKWTSDDLTLTEADAAKNPLTFTMPGKAVTITATFKDLVLEEGEYAISVDTEIVNGSVNVDKPKAKEGDTVTVIVTPADGYELEAITVNGKAIDGTTFEMPGEAVTVSASFKKTTGGGEDPNPPAADEYTITCDTAVNGTVTADKAKAKAGDTVTLTVKAAEGYELDTLTVNGKAITGTTFTMPAENVTVKATFKKTGGDEPTPPTPTEVDKTALEAALAAAKAIDPASVETSADGKDVPTTKTWVTQAVKDALAKAIADAEALAADADQAAVDAAAKALEDAVAAWAPKAGTKRTFSGGGGSSSSSSTGKVVASVTNPAGGKTTVKKDHEGNVTITATDDKGEVIAEVKLPATAPSVGYKFVDVPENHWAEKAINDMAGLELVKGVNEADHLFDMVSPITRGSVATILSRLANGKADVKDVFSDVAEGQWFAEGVAWAAKAGVVTGFENGTFQPDGSITREQLAVMLARYAKLLGLDTDAAIGELAVFNDAESIQSWAREGMAWCVKVGIIQGRGDSTVDPGANATRAEAAVMLARLVDLLK